MNVLVMGGAGYIGSVTVAHLVARGDRVVVGDNLATGHRRAVGNDVSFEQVDLRETDRLATIMKEHDIEAVVHFAAASLVGESMADPAKYFDNNVAGSLSLLRAMNAAGVERIVFSSTAATYGEPTSVPLREDHPTHPTNTYGLTKLMIEQAMRCWADAYGLQFVALRYFNACGAIPTRGEDHRPETHLVPLVLQVAQGKRASINVFGTDYDTPDGTCIRDYIHVADLAEAHLAALDYMTDGGKPLICNLGSGAGFSVRQLIDTCAAVTRRPIAVVEGPRRAGDPSRLIADATLARKVLGWQPSRPELETIIADAWRWHEANPDGYGSPSQG